MASILKVDKLDPQSGTALEIGSSGDTITIPSGATFTQSGTMNASAITAGTIDTARLGSGTASSSTVLYGDQTYKAEPGGGKIGQVLSATKTDTQSTTSDDWVDIADLTLNITCATTSSKVYIAGFVQLSFKDDTTPGIAINAGGGIVGSGAAGGSRLLAHSSWSYIGSAGSWGNPLDMMIVSPVNYLWSPNSTSEQTVKLQFTNNDVTGATLYINRSNDDADNYWDARTVSTLTIMEVLA